MRDSLSIQKILENLCRFMDKNPKVIESIVEYYKEYPDESRLDSIFYDVLYSFCEHNSAIYEHLIVDFAPRAVSLGEIIATRYNCRGYFI